jgi:lipopolysaccharide biosynthesis glycosyltransferase
MFYSTFRAWTLGRADALVDGLTHEAGHERDMIQNGSSPLGDVGVFVDGCGRCTADAVHVAIVAAGIEATRSLLVVIKSILMHRTAPLKLHLLVDSSSHLSLNHTFATWRLACVDVTFHMLLNHTAEIAWVPTTHASGAFGLSKLMYERVLPRVDKVIALDTDLILRRDIAELWALFRLFSPAQMLGAVAQQSDWYLGTSAIAAQEYIWPAVGRGINSGVMLLHLQRLRTANWRQTWFALTRVQLQSTPSTSLADQDVFNLVQTHNSAWYFEIPCHWNLQIHNRSSYHTCFSQHGASIVHWNSPAKRKTRVQLGDLFLRMYRLVQSTDGSLLRDPPSGCLVDASEPAHLPMTNRSEDECEGFRRSGQLLYRTVLDYVFSTSAKRVYECRIAGLSAEATKAFNSQSGITKIQTNSALVAQHRFVKLVGESRQRLLEAGVELPDPLAAVCDEVVELTSAERGRTDVTLATQLSFDRLQALGQLILAWVGPMSVALYLDDSNLAPFEDWLEAEMGSLTKRSADFALHLVFRDGDHYPVNYLRNTAISVVRTTHVVNLDIDFIPSQSAYERIKSHLETLLFLAKPRMALVLPAFETDRYSASGLPDSKQHLQEQVRINQMRQFREREWAAGHESTNYSKWFAASQVFRVRWREGYEPYVVVATDSPRYAQLILRDNDDVLLACAGALFFTHCSSFLLHLQI